MSDTLKESAFTLLGWGSLWVVVTACLLWRWLRGSKGRELREKGGSQRVLLAAVASVGAVAFGLSAWGLWVRYRPQPAPLTRQLDSGAIYRRFSRSVPRAIVVHLVDIDLKVQGLRFWVTEGPTDTCLPALKTTRFLAQTSARLAINTQYFRSCPGAPNPDAMIEGAPVAPLGVAIANRRPIVTQAWGSTLYIDANNHLTLDQPPADVVFAISGDARLVTAGVAHVIEDARLAPRTALGITAADSRHLLLLVVDGRQPGYSEGLTLTELANLMVELGVADGLELDGGGSATLAARSSDGEIELLNSPIHGRIPGRERPVASHLAVGWTTAGTGK